MIIRIFLLLSVVFIFFCKCKEDNSGSNNIDLFNKGLILYSDPATDGCGWLIFSEETTYKPVNLPLDFQIDSLEVLFTYTNLGTKPDCGPFNNPLFDEINIDKIKNN